MQCAINHSNYFFHELLQFQQDLGKVSRKLTSVRKENVELKKIIHWNKWKPAGTADSDAPDSTAMVGIGTILCMVPTKL